MQGYGTRAIISARIRDLGLLVLGYGTWAVTTVRLWD